MKKFIMGLIIGMLVMAGSSVFADDAVKSLIGQRIQGQFDVSVNGERLETPAIAVNGISFLPARSFAERLGYKVSFDPEGGIELEGQTTEEEEAARQQAEVEKKTNVKNQLILIESNLSRVNDMIGYFMNYINQANERLEEKGLSDAKIQSLSDEIQYYDDKIKPYEEERQGLLAQQTTLQAELDALE